MKNINHIIIGGLALVFFGCKAPSIVEKEVSQSIPAHYNDAQDSTNTGKIIWQEFFVDENLKSLIDTALKNNQELNIISQEINIANNEVRTRKGEYLPFLNLNGGAGAEKVGRYTSQGANDANTDIAPGQEFPEPLSDFMLAPSFSWEIDVWKKLRNAKKASAIRYLSSIEGKNFMVTQLISEIANSYYELIALDNRLEILNQNILIQENALKTVKMQKQAAKVTELAVKKFEAEVFKNKSNLYYIKQEIFEIENRINFLVGRYPQKVERSKVNFMNFEAPFIKTGVPSQLLTNRPDIKQAELQLQASKLDVKSARANFYPSFNISANLGYQAFNSKYFLKTPESLMYSLAGDFVAPLLNKNAIKATYFTANNKQTQAVYKYEQTVLDAFTEVLNLMSKIENLDKSYNFQSSQVNALNQSINISGYLFKSARADYMEVLMTQRDALDAKMELIETKRNQMTALVQLYKALGGGWK